MLGGDSTVVEYQPSMTIQKLKDFVKSRLGPVPEKQRLLYKEQELKVRKTWPIYRMQTANCTQTNATVSNAISGCCSFRHEIVLNTRGNIHREV